MQKRQVSGASPRCSIRLLAPGGEQNGPMTEGCVICDHDRLREADLYLENDFCIYSSTRDPRDPPDVIPGCGTIVPKAHRASPFDLTAEEWAATRELLLLVRAELRKRLAPDGYTLGWNDQGGLHPTCMSSRASMTSRWPAKASDRESRIPPIGDLIRGAPAPGGTWPDHETSLGAYSLAATVCCMPRVEFRAPLTGKGG